MGYYSLTQYDRSRGDKNKNKWSNCGDIANMWREINTKYHDSRNNDPKQQGNYTPGGKLMIGYLCQ